MPDASVVRPRNALVILLAAALAVAPDSSAQHAPSGHAADVHFEISCSDDAGMAFERAVALLHHMTYPAAHQAFAAIAAREPSCALAHWGVAMTLFQPLWPTRPDVEARRQGWAAVQRARALEPATERERLFLATAEAFFLDPDSDDYWTRIHRWEAATARLYHAYPGDEEASAFYALALLAVAGTREDPRSHQDRAAELLLDLHARNERHPGASHYLIHANDVQGREGEHLDIVRGYSEIAPRNPHALHMPTHIYTRLGAWDDVVQGNLRAADAALEHRAGNDGQYVWDEFPHAVEYLVYAYLQQGDDASAAGQIARLHATQPLHPTFKTAFHLASVEARYALERQDWERAAVVPVRAYDALAWDRYPWPEAISWYARGMGAAALGDTIAAQRTHDRLRELSAGADDAGEAYFARQIDILAMTVEAWIDQAAGRHGDARAGMEAAAALEAATPKHPVTPAPTLPAAELLGAMLLAQSAPADALAAYEHALEAYPRRYNSVLGAARAARALDDVEAARRHYAVLIDLGAPATSRPGAGEARAYLEATTGDRR